MAVRDTLELDISPALQELERLSASLTQVTQEFKVDLSDAISILGDSSVTVSADASAVTADVDAALADASDTIEVGADPNQLALDLQDGISSADGSTVEVDADTSAIPPAIEEAVQSVGKQEIEVDASQATQSLGDLKGSAQDASTAVLGVGTTSAASAASISGATGAVTSLGSSIPGIAAGAAAFTGMAAAGDQFFNSAVNSTAATQRFNQTLGASADQVNTINIGGLNADLVDLNLSLGSSTSQTREAVSSFAQMGIAAGKSQEEVAGTSEQLVALSARAVALNPNLGSVGDVAQRMQTGLARGGRFAAQFGIQLTSAEINARALADTGKSTADQLTIYEKSAAGAALATEKYGSTIKETIDKGSENPIIKLRSISAEFAKFTTELGKPLITPAFDLIRSVQPLLQNFATLIANALKGLLPGLTAVIQAITPLSDILITLLTPAFEVLGPILQLLAAPIQVFAELLRDALKWVQSLPEPLKLVVSPLSVLSDVFKELGLISVPPAVVALKDAAGVTIQMADGADLLKTSLSGTPEEFAKMQLSATGFAAAGVPDQLRQTAVSMDDLNRFLQQGDTGFKQFTASGIKAGTITLRDTSTGAELSADKISHLSGNLDQYIQSGQIAVEKGGQLTQTFRNQAQVMQQTAKAELDAKSAQFQLTEEQRKHLALQASASFGANNAVTQLKVLNQEIENGTIKMQGSNTALTNNAAAWVALAGQVANGTVTQQNAAQVAQTMGVTIDQAKQAIDAASQAVDNFVNNAVTKVPTAASTFEDLKSKTNPADPLSFKANLDAATLSTLTFGQNIETIAKEKFPEVAAFLSQQGPEAAGTFAQSFLKLTDVQKQQVEDSIKLNESGNKAYGETIRKFAGDNITAATDLGSQMTKGFGDGLNFKDVTGDQVQEARKALTDSKVIDPAKADAAQSGDDIGNALGFALGTGIGKNTPFIQQQARDAIKAAEKAAKEEAGIKSPSRLFEEIGGNLTAGLAQGMSAGGDEVVAEAERIVREASKAASTKVDFSAGLQPTLRTALAPQAAGPTGPSPILIQNMPVSVSLPGGATKEEAKAAGEAVAAGIVSGLTVRQITVDAKVV